MDKGEIIREICHLLINDNKQECRQLANQEYPFVNPVRGKRKYTPAQQLKVFLRDGFIDRYSGEKLLFPGIFRILKRELPDIFPAHQNWKMSETHIVYWELFPTIDHLYPVARGGMDNENNWITTSMLKNSAKSNWTVEELGWEIKEPGNLELWDGLTGIFIKLVENRKDLLNDDYIRKWNTALLTCLK